MEIWGGIEPVERSVSTPGLDLWVFSRPFHGDQQGGDVYYVTLCGGGVITRIVVADVSGHGASVAEFSTSLRSLLRKNINQKSQKRLVEKLNRQFTEMAGDAAVCDGARDDLSRVARSVVRLQRRASAAALLSGERADLVAAFATGEPTRRLRATCRWVSTTRPAIRTFDVELGRGDLLVFYTDASERGRRSGGQVARREGITGSGPRLDLADARPGAIGPALLEAVARHREHRAAEDDVTLVVLHHNASPTPRLSLGEKVDVYAKVFGLKAV